MKSLGYIGAFIGGAVAGAVIGLLVAPEKGSDTRTKITGAVKDSELEEIEKKIADLENFV